MNKTPNYFTTLIQKRNLSIAAITISVISLFFMIYLQHSIRPYALEDGYFHRWTSEHMMQTLPIEELRDNPIHSVLGNHISPPLFSVIRAILANIFTTDSASILTLKVDTSLYFFGALLYSILGTIIFLWLAQLTNIRFAFIASLFFILHPACIFFATFLDATFLSSVLIIWMYYLLWRFRANQKISILGFTLIVLILFFARSIFQLPSLIIFAISLLLLKVPKNKIGLFLALTVTVVCVFLIKQHIKFDIHTTSSFAGLSLTRSVGMSEEDFYTYYTAGGAFDHDILIPHPVPKVMSRKRKWTGTPNFNHFNYLFENKILMKEYKNKLASMSIMQLVNNYIENFRLYFEPTTNYEKGNHVIVNHLSWHSSYNKIFSYPVLPSLLLFALCIWLFSPDKSYLTGIALILPGLYIFLVSVLFEKGENMRFKLFLEPVMFIFICSQIYTVVKIFHNKFLKIKNSHIKLN